MSKTKNEVKLMSDLEQEALERIAAECAQPAQSQDLGLSGAPEPLLQFAKERGCLHLLSKDADGWAIKGAMYMLFCGADGKVRDQKTGHDPTGRLRNTSRPLAFIGLGRAGPQVDFRGIEFRCAPYLPWS
jgi:hypothetical protein